MEEDGHIFICDPPPGSKLIVSVSRRLTMEEANRLKAQWEAALSGPSKVIIIDEGMKVFEVPGTPQWPDSEFCAA